MKQKYSSYKDSGVEWIGEIPSHWSLTKIKQLFEDRNEKNDEMNEFFLSITKDRGVIPYSEKGNVGNKTSEDIGKYKKVYVGDIVLNPMNIIIGSVGVSKFEGVLSNVYIVLNPINVSSKFGSYIFHHKSFQLHLKKICYGIMELRESLNKIEFFVEKLPLPSNEEQQQIVTYLDQKTSQIDTLVSLTEKKIELLREKRTSLINEAVTKGLDKSVKMKDSGVEWIGEIPIHWEIRPLKTITDVRPSNVDKHIYPDEIQVELCNYTDVYKNDFIDKRTPLKVGSCTETEFSRFCLKKGDVIITKDSETSDDIGIPCLITEDLTNVVCGYHLTLLRPISVVGGFLFRVFQTQYIKSYFENESNGITRVALGKSSIESTFIVYPPLPEQQQIVDYINHHTSEIDKLISIEQRRIDTLKEYRQSLISEVVTGKVKVSNS